MPTLFAGLDLGGTKIAGILFDIENHKVLAREMLPTEGYLGPEHVIARMGTMVQSLCTQVGLSVTEIQGVGIGAPCTIDYDAGLSLMMSNIPGEWYKRPVEKELQGHIGIQGYLVNDARAFTLAESTVGAGKEFEVVIGLTLGTGIGGGIAINGKLYMGMDGNAAEFGHTTIDMHGIPDGSTTPGTVEGYASGPAITAQAIKAIIQGYDTILGELVENDLNRMTPRIVDQAAELGDAVACDILERAGTYLGIGLANVVTILAPNCVVIGGGMTALGDRILIPLKNALYRYSNTVNHEKLVIRYAELGKDAGAIGAALWASQKYVNSGQ